MNYLEGGSMNKLDIGGTRFTEILRVDEKGAGGAFHEYQIVKVNTPENGQNPPKELTYIKFQKGGVAETGGVNGIFVEDLLAICIDRLRCFHEGPFPSRQNALALTKLQEAMFWLNDRTADRQRRGVEGISVA
jgi:hypothetical protein